MASFLDLFPAVDSAGAQAAKYRLHFLGSTYTHQESWVFGLITEIVYTGYKYVAVAANGLMGLVLSSGTWMDPLSRAYQRITLPLYQVIPPWAIACLGVGIVAFSTLLSRPKTTSGSFFDSRSLNRIGTALALMIAVLVLTHDPFGTITKVLQVANGFSVELSAALTDNANDTTITAGQALVNNSIRTPTIALNYGGNFTDECKTLWSRAMESGQELPESSGCYISGQNAAGADTLFTALLMIFLPALPMLVFSVIAAWKFVLHLSMAVLCAAAAAWVAAFNVHKRRGFDNLSEMVGLAAAHTVMAVVTSTIAVALPTIASGLATDLLHLSSDADVQSYVLMLSMGIGFIVSTYVLYRVTSNHGALVRILKADANTTLERTLGVSTAPVQLQVNRLNPFSHRFGAPENEEKGPATAGDVMGRNPAAAGQTEGVAAVNEQSRVQDDRAVKQLLVSAASIAEAKSTDSQTPTRTVVSVPAADPQVPDSRAWQLQQQLEAPTSTAGDAFKDVFGLFTVPDRLGAETVNLQSPVPPGNSDVSETPGVITPNVPAPDNSPPSQPATYTGTQQPVTGADQSPLATPAASRVDAREETIVPVPGNLFVDPALNEVAKAASATFSVAPASSVSTRVRSLLSRFSTQKPLDPVPFSTPSVAHGSALQIVTEEQPPTGAANETSAAAEAENLTGQQRWNLRSRLGRRKETKKQAVTSSEPDPLPPSGIGTGTNRHPASFQAPMPDFLASAQLESDIEEVVTTLAAAGKPVRVSLPVNDSRLALQLSSDPDRRIVPMSGIGFGDPV